MIQTIVNSSIFQQIIGSLIVWLLSCIVNIHEKRHNQKAIGRWKIGIKKIYSFYDVTQRMYLYMLTSLATMHILCSIFSLYFEQTFCYFYFGIGNILLNILIVYSIQKEPKTKAELWSDSQNRKGLLRALGFIFSAAYFIDSFSKYRKEATILYYIALIIWAFYLCLYIDFVYILEKSYADIYINNNILLKKIDIKSIKKRGEWIYLTLTDADKSSEIRIRENTILRIDYYGEPILKVDKLPIKEWLHTYTDNIFPLSEEKKQISTRRVQMIAKLKKGLIFIIHYAFSCFKLLFYSFFALFRLILIFLDKDSPLFILLYQPLSLALIFFLFSRKIDSMVYGFIIGQGNLAEAALLIFFIIAFMLFIYAFVELLLRFICKDIDYDKLFLLQKYANSYIMAIISLIAIYTAIDSVNAKEINSMLLTIGIIFFICTLITDVYNELFFKPKIVKTIYDNMRKQSTCSSNKNKFSKTDNGKIDSRE